MEVALVVLFLLILGVIVIAFIIFDVIKDDDDWVYPDGKKGMVKVKLPNIFTGQPFVMSANTDSPRWWDMFFRNIEMMNAISCETATKMVNGQPLTQEEIDKIKKQKEYVDKKYGTKEEILSGHGVYEEFRNNLEKSKKIKMTK